MTYSLLAGLARRRADEILMRGVVECLARGPGLSGLGWFLDGCAESSRLLRIASAHRFMALLCREPRQKMLSCVTP